MKNASINRILFVSFLKTMRLEVTVFATQAILFTLNSLFEFDFITRCDGVGFLLLANYYFSLH